VSALISPNGVSEKGVAMRLSIEVGSDLHEKVKIAATERDMTVRDYVVGVLEAVMAEEARANGEDEDLTRLSLAAFARDWDSEEDSIYDELR
jgi:hypothetical protein